MKRLLLLAPGLVPPFTEGRKRFVLDLVETGRSSPWHIRLLTGEDAGIVGMVRSLAQLRWALNAASADAVVAFPHGTFSGIRRYASDAFIRIARRLCASRDVPFLPVFYSCAGLSLANLGKRYSPAMTVGIEAEGLWPLMLGLGHEAPRWQRRVAVPRRALFLCGYQQASRAALADVLHQRGLLDLLRAGDALAENGVSLRIAIPFLRDAKMREALSRVARTECPALVVEMHAEVDTADAFGDCDFFCFPYRAEHSVFVPTSLLEAMAAGIPTLAADQPMYRRLTVPNGETLCALHRTGDARDLAGQIGVMCAGYDKAITRAQFAADQIRREWTIERSLGGLTNAIMTLR